MITLKTGKAICPVCDVKNSNSISSVSDKLTTLGLFFVENKIEQKQKLDSFQEKITLNHLKIVSSFEPSVHL